MQNVFSRKILERFMDITELAELEKRYNEAKILMPKGWKATEADWRMVSTATLEEIAETWDVGKETAKRRLGLMLLQKKGKV